MASLKVSNRHEIALLLSQMKEEILRDWEAQCRERVPAAKAQSPTVLRNSLPLFLDQMIVTLAEKNPDLETEKNADVARIHAEDRSQKTQYTLNEVIFEYHILRSVLMKNMAKDRPVDSESQQIVHSFIDRGISKAAVRYAEIELNRSFEQRKKIEEARLEAERANQAKSAFLANMSHEIRTPLGAIMGFVELLKENGLMQKDISNYLGIIERNSRHLLRIIDDILDLAKVESGKMAIEKIEFSPVEFLAEFASLAALKAREKGIAFELKEGSLLPKSVITDPTRVRQILSNIVGNAIKFTDNGVVQLSVSYLEKALLFRVSDTGRGISADQRSQIFQAFTQADSSTTRKFGGTGLGLVLTKRLCQALGGDFLLVQSDLGKGSLFEAQVQVAIPENVKLVPIYSPAQPVQGEMRGETRKNDLRGLRILLVEDSPDNQVLIQRIISKAGGSVEIANDGVEGVEKAMAHDFDVVLMDIQMPNMDGHEAMRTLLDRGYKGRVVALTAHAMAEERARAMISGFSGFLTKPIDRSKLYEMLVSVQKTHNLQLQDVRGDIL